jgi:hypothetical protein
MSAPSAWQNFIAIVGLPLVVWITALGTGLAVERVTRASLSNALLLPLGLATGICIVYPLYALDFSDVPAVVLLVLVSAAGLIFARGGLRSRINPGWPGLAALAVYVLFQLPVLVAGHWLWEGYNFDNDTAVQFLLIAHLKIDGLALPPITTTAGAVLYSYLKTAYPLGGHVELATLSGLVHTPPEVLYQSYLSTLAALIALTIAASSSLLIGARRAVVLGFAAASANLFYQYAMQGNIKEIATAAMAVAAFALLSEAIRARKPYSGAVIGAIPLAAVLCTYGVAGTPYVAGALGAVALQIVIIERRLPRPSWAGPTALGLGALGALSIPAIVNFSTLFAVEKVVVGNNVVDPSASVLGQLLRPLPLSQISGVWLSGIYRVPIAAHPAGGLTSLASAVILVLLIPGVLWSARRRDAAAVLGAVTVGGVLLIIVPRVTPYAIGKVYAMAGPIVVWIAGIGLCSIGWRRARPLVFAVGVALTLAIVVSDLLAYHVDQISPTSRMLAIEATAKHVSGRGRVLFNEADEFVKYFARAAETDAPFEAITPEWAQLIQPDTTFNTFYDLDQETLPFVESFPVIVTRRSPIASRPPANYRLIYENAYYDAWQRDATPKVTSFAPQQSEWAGSAVPACQSVQALVTGAPRKSLLVQAVVPPTTGFAVATAPSRPAYWTVETEPGVDPYDAVIPQSPGFVHEEVTVPAGGVYEAWVQGSFSRPVQVFVNGRLVGAVDGLDSVDQWSRAGAIRLKAGRYELAIHRGGGRIYPGDGAFGEIGYVMLAKQGPEVLHTVPLSKWRSLCTQPADWIDLVQP